MLSAASDTPTPPWSWSQRNVARDLAMEKITCPRCGSDRLIKIQMKRVTRAGKALTVYCCASDPHMFSPEIEPQELTSESNRTTARPSRKRRGK
jgi:DNA-directed RNA polymerase subunit RPC12/RpoP